MKFHLISIFIIAIFCKDVLGGKCEDEGGSCVDWRTTVCHAGLEVGICPGDSNLRCCLYCDAECEDNEANWSLGDAECTSVGGQCKHFTNYCPGSYASGLCGGPSERQCCKQNQGLPGCPRIISRGEWGAIPTSCHNPMGDERPYLFVHHSEGSSCYDEESCSSVVRGIQSYHINGNGWCDIGYSFLVGGDGNIYEGRGWNEIGAHTLGFNSMGYGVCFLGSFMEAIPTDEAIDTFSILAECMMENAKITSGYELKGHRQTKPTDCPGDALYEEIQSWPHWTDGYIGDVA